jgi:hypothetical protein
MAFQSKGTGAIDLAAGSSGVNISNGGTVTAITRTATGSAYTSIPSVAISTPTTAGGVQATASANMFQLNIAIVGGGIGYTVNDVLTVVGGTGSASQITVSTVSAGVITSITPGPNSGLYSVLPINPVSVTGGTGSSATFNILTYGVSTVSVGTAGSGYVEQPTITFSGGGGSGAAAYATVGSGTVVRSLGAILSFYTPNQQIAFQVADYGGSVGTGYWSAYGGNIQPILTAIGSNSGVIQTTSAVPLLLRTGGIEQFRVAHTASAVNYVQVTGGASGAPGVVTMSAQGSSTDVDIAITPKGAGVVKFGTYTAGIIAQAGYITIKDSGGTVRRLLVG